MSLRWRVLLYLVVLHCVLAGLAVYLFLQNRLWLIAIEGVLVLSLLAGASLTRAYFRRFSFAAEGSSLMREHDFTSRFREIGQPEVDALIRVYNQMVDHLRDERTRVQEQHYFLSRILQVSPLAILTLDFDERVALANPTAERLLGQPSEALLGRRLTEIVTPLAETFATLEPGESRVVAVQGARRVKLHRGTFLDRGFPRAFVLMEELTEALRQFEKAAYEKLIRVMSHEVNNTIGASNSLLHSCLTYARELKPESRSDFEEAIRIVIGRTDQLNHFMRSFADVVRLPAPVLQKQDLQPLLARIARLLEADSARRAIRWDWDVQDTGTPPLRVNVDRGQMEQAFVNIFKNALEAIGSDGLITVRLLRRDHRATVIVEDSGPGIAPEARANLFTPFFSTKEAGQGIGLTLVQEILTQHQCEYALESPPGGPTQFTVVFPPV